MKNTLGDLNNHLFMQLERLNDEDLNEEELKKEVTRAKAISDVSGKAIENGRLMLDARKFADDRIDISNKLPKMLGE